MINYEKISKKYNVNKKKFKKSKKINLSDKKRLTFTGSSLLILKYLIIVFICMIILYPIIYLIVSSFNGNLTRSSLTATNGFSFSVKNFSDLNNTYYWKWLWNSLLIGFISMFVVVIFSGLMAYGFSRYNFRGKKAWLIFIILIGLVPNLLSLIIFYVITDILNQRLGMPRMITLLLIYTGGGIVGNLYILKTYMDNISKELDDSGKIDGLSNWNLFLRIIAPLAKPMLSIVAFWSFLAPFGDVILSSLILDQSKEYTIAIGLMSFIKNKNPLAINYPMFAAGSLLVALPITVVFLILQRNITTGLAEGGVK